MKRLQWLLRERSVVRYPEDVRTIRIFIGDNKPHVTKFSDNDIAYLYEEFSEECYCAGWLSMEANAIPQFKEWLEEEMDP
jgi:hypothetical protein